MGRQGRKREGRCLLMAAAAATTTSMATLQTPMGVWVAVQSKAAAGRLHWQL